MGAKAPKAGHYRHALRGAWRDTMTRETGTKIVLLGDKGPTDGRTVYSVSSSITRLTRVRQGPMLKALCEISVTLDQNGSIVMMTSGGATVEAYPLRFGHREAQELETNALRAAVTSAHHNVMRFLAR